MQENAFTDWLTRLYDNLGKWAIVVPVGMLAVVLFLSMRSCSSSDPATQQWGGKSKEAWLAEHAKRQAAEDAEDKATAKKAADHAAAAKAAVLEAAVAAKAKSRRPWPAGSTIVNRPVQVQIAAKSVRPEDLAAWKKEDYENAREENDPRLVDAIGEFGRRFANSAAAVKFLLGLLKESEGQVAFSRADEAIIGALAANQTEDARQALLDILRGNVKTTDDRRATKAALEALAGRSADQGDLLFQLVTAPEQFRASATTPVSAVSATVTADELRKSALALTRSQGSESLRTRLARYATAPNSPPADRAAIQDLLREARVENIRGQILLYSSEETEPRFRDSIQELFTRYSSQAMARTLGIPQRLWAAGPSTAAAATLLDDGTSTLRNALAPRAKADMDPLRAAEYLWDREFAATVERRLRQVGTLKEGAPVFWLASTIPVASTRTVLRRTLEQYASEGPASVDAAGNGSRVITDPGIIVALKSVIRNDRRSRAAVLGKSTALREAQQRQLQQRLLWSKSCEGLVRSWCSRLRTTAEAQSTREVVAGSGNVDLPIELYPRTGIISEYHLEWPGPFGKALAELKLQPMRIHYVSIKEKVRPSKVLSHYRGQLKPCEDHPIQNGIWLDGFEETAGHQQSVDVFITGTGPSSPAGIDQEQFLTIDILAIEINGEEPIVESRPSRSK